MEEEVMLPPGFLAPEHHVTALLTLDLSLAVLGVLMMLQPLPIHEAFSAFIAPGIKNNRMYVWSAFGVRFPLTQC